MVTKGIQDMRVISGYSASALLREHSERKGIDSSAAIIHKHSQTTTSAHASYVESLGKTLADGMIHKGAVGLGIDLTIAGALFLGFVATGITIANKAVREEIRGIY